MPIFVSARRLGCFLCEFWRAKWVNENRQKTTNEASGLENDETYLSTKLAQTLEQTWLSVANENESRASCACTAASQGTSSSDGLRLALGSLIRGASQVVSG
jgi:hypothetical protein